MKPFSVSRRSKTPMGALIVAMIMAIWTLSAPAATLVVDGDTADNTAFSDGVDATSVQQIRATRDSGSRMGSAILVFQLPDLGGEIVTNASLSFAGLDHMGTGTANADLYGVRTDSSSTVVLADHYDGALDGSATLIQDNIFDPGMSPLWTNLNTSAAGDSALAAWLRAQYDGGAVTGDYAFLRFSLDADPGGDFLRYWVASADSLSQATPVLTIETGPAPITHLYDEDFEAPLTNGQFIAGYDVWTSDIFDKSAVLATNYSYTATSRPLELTDDAQVLKLRTDGGVLTNLQTIPEADRVLYVDQMVNMTALDSAPGGLTNDPTVQVALYLDTNDHVVVYQGGMDGTDPGFTAITNTTYASNTWYRLTMTFDYVNGDGIAPPTERRYVKIQVNGQDLTSPDAYSSPGVTGSFDGGAWFFTADNGVGADTIEFLTFEGNGFVDDLVVTTNTPDFGSLPTAYTIHTDLTGPGSVAPAGDIVLDAGGTTQVVFTADLWHEIDSLTTNGAPLAAADGEGVYTAVFANVQSDISNAVVYAVTLAPVDGKTPATWYGPLGADDTLDDEDGDGLSLYEEYLVNTHPTVSNAFSITSFGVDTNDKPELQWESLGLPNGTLVVQDTADLPGGPWDPVSGSAAFATGVTTWTGDAAATGSEDYLSVDVQE